MKKIYIYLLIILTTMISCKNQQLKVINKTDIDIVKDIMNKQENSWNSGNLVCFMDSYWKSDSLNFIGKSGVNYGWETTLENYQKSYKNQSEMGVLSFNNISIDQLSSDYIYVIGKWYLKRQEPLDDLSGHYTLIWRKMNGKWLIISDHSS